jgi:arylsulfatase A-like enzyme
MKQMFRLAVVAALTQFAASVEAATYPKPNVIFFLIDDWGWTDLACMGSKLYETPNLDKLASQGMKFTQAYSACTVCSPTRAAVMTGKYPARLHVTDWIAGHNRPFAKLKIPDWTKYLPLEETTIAELLKQQQYATASIGKWHLGGEGYEPTQQGFDVNIGGDHRGSPPSYFSPYNIPTLSDGPKGESLTDRLTAEAIQFIEKQNGRPFFIYFPHYTVHTPLQAKPEVVAKYQAKLKRMNIEEADNADLQKQHRQNNPIYAAMVESVDDSVGAVMAALDRLKLADDTLIFLTGDNGGLMRSTDNSPARVGKGSAYEGGVRVPLIVRYPRAVKPGGETDVPVMSIDYLPTILELVDPMRNPPVVDGVSFAGLLRGQAPPSRTELFWHYPHYHPGGATPYGAIRDGDWRLVEFYEDNRIELYNLRDDVGEKSDLATKDPSRADALRKRLHAWRDEVGAQMPTPNPDYNPAKDAAQGRPRKPAKK